MDNRKHTFFELLEKIADYGSIKSPDFMAMTIPLLEYINQLHEHNTIAFINSIDKISYDGSIITIASEGTSIVKGSSPLFVKPSNKSVINVSQGYIETTDIDNQNIDYINLDIQIEDRPIDKPVYMLDYKSWDYEKGHYNPLTDVFILGQILASIAFNLDFRNKGDLETFVSNRKKLYFLNKSLHPTIINIIYEMTHLYCEDRTKSLSEVISKLNNYREYNPENYVDLTQTDGFRSHDVSERGNWILSKLKNRLFDISRRNKLLYFSEKERFLNLTVASVPLLLDYNNINDKDLIVWNDSIKKSVIKNKKITLNAFLDFKENKFLAPSLNNIRLESKKSVNEYGFSPLRTVIAFIHWYNFKENREERITSPFLLLPTVIVKNKGVEDHYALIFQETEAEINPILSHYLKELYNITLPDFIDLETSSIKELVDSIEIQIAGRGTGVLLEWRQQPKIRLIHSIAKKNYSLKNKRLENRSKGLNVRLFSYSYNRDDFQPLGIQMFNERVRHANNALEYIINEDLNPIENRAIEEKVRTFYTSDNDGEINPLVWEIDTCNITIGNFNYRKMSLVRDYNEIIKANKKDEIFEQLFSEVPKRLSNSKTVFEGLENNYPIISSDPTQTKAIQIARTGESYIIQGPPGTGKSQTITNLIADYIARDKKILFVCEKRAALDVVFHRLRNRKLDELCCLIHDSQTDKKAFIQNLKATYNTFLEDDIDHSKIEAQRKKIIDTLNLEVNKLRYFHHNMKSGDVPPVDLFQVLLATSKGKEIASDTDLIHYPSYQEWKKNSAWIGQWVNDLSTNGFQTYISKYPLRQISEHILKESNPKAVVLDKINTCVDLLDEFSELVDEIELETIELNGLTIQEWINQFKLISRIEGIFNANKLPVFKIDSNEAFALNSFKNQIDTLVFEKKEIQTKNKNWQSKFTKEDTELALKQWRDFEKNIFRFFLPSYYKLKSLIISAYNFDAHDIKPKVINVLESLSAEYGAESQIAHLKTKAQDTFGIKDFDSEYAWINSIYKAPNPILTAFCEQDSNSYIRTLLSFSAKFNELVDHCKLLFSDIEELSLIELDRCLSEGKGALSSLSVFIPHILESKKLSKEMKSCLFSKKWTVADFEFGTAYKSLRDIYEKERPFAGIDEDDLQTSISRINDLLGRYYDINVEKIRSKVRLHFLKKVRISESTAAQLNAEEKMEKKVYNSARKILENEFGKSMRYKSIRELASNEANVLMTAIKPVWLMSPLSVSDTMPIDPSLFDVVIYDEASQITVEEGVPSLFRTNQTIVVGDEMQMPPTTFFSTNTAQDEEDDLEEKIGITLDADSLLNQSSRKLPSVMLGWHYRSRRESLISFSNAAFYKRSLLTIPDSIFYKDDAVDSTPIADVSADIDINTILDKSISYCFLENATYENRKNKDEAAYIANLVCMLLKRKERKSIGVVAFSMEQQSEIEAALDRLAGADSEFETLLEEEYQREDEDQFNGLFVKNLENVQGDERDIIIMSVCYGYNAQGKMLMNFGPINRRGGEKRLNVIFSRAKHHMVVVTSIAPSDIKNDYNEGANYLKRFLTYAKYISESRLYDANLVLDSMYSYDEKSHDGDESLLAIQLRQALEERGYAVDMSIGQSQFKCDLGIKKNGTHHYELGILIDKRDYYASDDVLEQYSQKPQLLNAFGWKVLTVYAKDWFESPSRVINKIERVLSGNTETNHENIEELLVEKIEVTRAKVQTVVEEKEPVGEPQRQTGTEIDISFERLELKEGSGNKFWEVSVNDNLVIVRFGRIGNKPQENIKSYDSKEVAENEKNKLILTKLKKGYLKV
jgi:predicted DNA-binding WGR domain protein